VCEVRTLQEKNGVRRSKDTQNLIVYQLMKTFVLVFIRMT